MKKNTSWKFTDESSVTFQSSISGPGEFGLNSIECVPSLNVNIQIACFLSKVRCFPLILIVNLNWEMLKGHAFFKLLISGCDKFDDECTTDSTV